MSRSSVLRLTGIVAVASLILAFPAVAAATITGGCQGEGHATSGGVNITTPTEWHIRSTDVGGGSGTAPGKIHAASVGAYAGGIPIPIVNGTSEDGETTGAVDGVAASVFATLGARFTIAGNATGDANCSGQITMIIDDVNPAFTVLGGGGLLLAVLGLLAILMAARSRSGAAKVVAFVFGALGGLGLGLALEQFGIVNPTQPITLAIAAVEAIIGLLLAGRLAPAVEGVPT